MGLSDCLLLGRSFAPAVVRCSQLDSSVLVGSAVMVGRGVPVCVCVCVCVSRSQKRQSWTKASAVRVASAVESVEVG